MKVKVWNHDTREYSEKFKGEMVRIPANSFIWMEEDEAILFRGSYSPIVVDGLGNHLRPKKIALEYDPIERKIMLDQPLTESEKKEWEKKNNILEPKQEKEQLCHACGMKFDSIRGLNLHIKHKHKELLDDDGKKAIDESEQ